MTEISRNKLNLVWLTLIIVTVISWWSSSKHGTGSHDTNSHVNTIVASVVLAIALAKSGLVLWNFMEVRDGPTWLKSLLMGWILLFFVWTTYLYLMSA